MSNEDSTPRFVISLVDTKTTVPGPNGDQYYSVTIGSDNLADFYRYIPPKDRKNAGKNEIQAMLMFFAEAVEKLDEERT